MVDIPEGFEPAGFKGRYLQDVGPYYVKRVADGFIVGMPILERHINYVDVAHGGVLSTLADVTLSLQIHRSEDPRPTVTTVSLNTNFLGGARLGEWLEGEGHIDRMGKRLAFTHGCIRASDKVIMTMTGVFNIIRG